MVRVYVLCTEKSPVLAKMIHNRCSIMWVEIITYFFIISSSLPGGQFAGCCRYPLHTCPCPGYLWKHLWVGKDTADPISYIRHLAMCCLWQTHISGWSGCWSFQTFCIISPVDSQLSTARLEALPAPLLPPSTEADDIPLWVTYPVPSWQVQ